MSTPESIAAAFAKGLVEGMLGNGKEKAVRPKVVKQDDVRQAVADFLKPMMDEPTPEQMDIFARDAENSPPDPVAEMTLRRVEEARMRHEQQTAEEENSRPDMFDPNSPSLSPWTSPR
jgi:hypothetical protein